MGTVRQLLQVMPPILRGHRVSNHIGHSTAFPKVVSCAKYTYGEYDLLPWNVTRNETSVRNVHSSAATSHYTALVISYTFNSLVFRDRIE